MPTFALILRNILLFSIVLAFAPIATSAELHTDFLMDSNPDCNPLPRTHASLKQFIDLWITTLDRPEVDYQRMSAESLALASQLNATGVGNAIPSLEKILVAEKSHPAARFSAARALITIDSRDSAEKLFQTSQKYGSDLRQLVEPALAEWNLQSIKPIWNSRLETPEKRPRDVMLAIRGVGKTQDSSALPKLRGIVFNLVLSPDIRLESASAMGRLAETGLETDAEQLSRESRTNRHVNCHCAIRLLARHESELARRVLTQLAVDSEPSIAAAALERLNEIDPSLVLPLANQGFQSRDAKVRYQSARSFLSLPTPERISALAMLLDDTDPPLRRYICENFHRLSAQQELDPAIRSSALEVLNGTSWRGQEQSALLLGQLEHQPAAARLVELLESPRKEVLVTSAWALRKIADTATVSAIIDKIQRQTAIRRVHPSIELDQQVAHLFEACGKMRIRMAEPLMRQHIPKDVVLGERSRSAAIWSLGWLHEGSPDEELAQQLMNRVNDESLMPPEFIEVKHQSTISIARMKAVQFAAELRKSVADSTPNNRLAIGRRWAVQHLTGEELPGPIAEPMGTVGWFLEPTHRVEKE